MSLAAPQSTFIQFDDFPLSYQDADEPQASVVRELHVSNWPMTTGCQVPEAGVIRKPTNMGRHGRR
ncbi:MAG: hypothetical protein AB7F89_15535, partial [Pirellulaceae bacterium]